MAIDFSELFTDIQPSAPASPYAEEDRLHFAHEFKGKAVARGTITAGLDQRRLITGLGDITVKASHGKTPIELALKGRRGDDWQEVIYKPLAKRRTDMLQAVDHPTEELFDTADNITIEVDVEGFWKKRWFKNRHGEWNSVLQFHVARFTHEGTAKGRLPEIG